jgi:tetratricopeptide (TPR) repeat protein
MNPDPSLLDQMEAADDAGKAAYSRYLCERVLADFPDHGPTLIRYARQLITFSLYDEARKVLDHAFTVVPEEHRHLVHWVKARWFKRQGNLPSAEEQSLLAYDLLPDDGTYLIYAGYLAFASGAIARAEVHLRRALACPEGCHDEAWFNLGGYLLAQKRFEEARDCYLEALKIDPDYSIAKERLEDVECILKDKDGHTR